MMLMTRRSNTTHVGTAAPSRRAETLGLFGEAQIVADYERYCKVVLISPTVPW